MTGGGNAFESRPSTPCLRRCTRWANEFNFNITFACTLRASRTWLQRNVNSVDSDLHWPPQDGTYNKAKQIMYGIFTSLIGQRCICERQLVLHKDPKGTSDDTRIYKFDALTGRYTLYRLTDISGLDTDDVRDKTVKGRRIRTQSWTPVYDFPDFNRVGIFKVEGYYAGEPEEIKYTDIKGKVVLIDSIDIAVVVPKNILDEAT